MSESVVVALSSRIVGEQFEIAVKTEAGIICDPTQLPQIYIRVLSVGPDVKGVKVGDTILAPTHGGQTVLHQGKIYRIFDQNEIYGLLNDPNISFEEKPLLYTV